MKIIQIKDFYHKNKFKMDKITGLQIWKESMMKFSYKMNDS